MGEFKPKKGIKERYTLTEDDVKRVITINEYKEKLIKSFMNNGMDKEGATLQALRKMYGCG